MLLPRGHTRQLQRERRHVANGVHVGVAGLQGEGGRTAAGGHMSSAEHWCSAHHPLSTGKLQLNARPPSPTPLPNCPTHPQVLVRLDAPGRPRQHLQLPRKQVGVGACTHAHQHQAGLQLGAALQHRSRHLRDEGAWGCRAVCV